MRIETLGLDFESYCELDLTEVGAAQYARHDSCEVLMLAYALGRPEHESKVDQWVPIEGQQRPRELFEMLRDPHVRKRAWNKPFEWEIFAHVLGLVIPHREWRDTMVKALTCSLPGKLEKAGPIIGLEEGEMKDSRGQLLIRTFCKPRKPSKFKPWTRNLPEHEPERWEEFKCYNRQDVVAEALADDILDRWDLPEHEWELWVLDQEINQRGLPVNMQVVRNALKISAELTEQYIGRLIELTGLQNPNSRNQMLGWLRGNGYPFEDLKKGHVARAAEAVQGEDSDYAEVLFLRKEVSRSSIDKYDALERATNDDGRIRGALQFAGAARTWRWGGRIYQPQNLAKPAKWIDDLADENQGILVDLVKDVQRFDTGRMKIFYGANRVMDVLSACVRPVIQAPDGCVFVDADLNAIENRVLGWLSGDHNILDVFLNKQDPYLAFGVHLYGLPYEVLWTEYKSGNKVKRTICKPGCLGCGYQLSAGEEFENETTGEIEATGLLGYAKNMGISLTKEQAELSVRVWRETYSTAVDYWYEIEAAAKKTIRTKRSHDAGPVWFDIDGPMMRMHLPSGRALHYVRPRLEHKKMFWGKIKEVITYENLDKGQWKRVQTHPGKLTENADQAISRDLLAHGMTLADRRGLDIVLHVHDQVVGEVCEDEAEKWLKILEECMSEPPPWARDIPLAAKGHISKYFLKD